MTIDFSGYLNEAWAPVPGYEGHYEVSDIGRVRSLDRVLTNRDGVVKRRRGRILKQQARPDGRRGVSLCLNDHRLEAGVHTLVLAAFVGPRPDGQVCRHLNDVPRDNRLVNLAYGTHSENALDLVRNGRHPWKMRTHCSKGHPYDESNTYVLPTRPTVRYCRQCRNAQARRLYAKKRAEALKLKIAPPPPTECKNGHPWTPENRYPWGGTSSCRVCHKELERRRRQRIKDAA